MYELAYDSRDITRWVEAPLIGRKPKNGGDDDSGGGDDSDGLAVMTVVTVISTVVVSSGGGDDSDGLAVGMAAEVAFVDVMMVLELARRLAHIPAREWQLTGVCTRRSYQLSRGARLRAAGLRPGCQAAEAWR